MGDNSILAWLVVLAYAAGALATVAAAQKASRRERRLWLLAAAALLLLGLNKQLDLQSIFINSVRDLAHAQGWYESRRTLQRIFIGGLSAAGIVGALLLLSWLRGSSATIKVAVAGLLALVLFVVVRAASFTHVDRWVTVEIAGLRSGWWLELGGIATIASAALVSRATSRPTKRVRTRTKGGGRARA